MLNKNNVTKGFQVCLFVIGVFLTLAKPRGMFAQYGEYGYGQQPVGQIELDKNVKNPSSGDFVAKISTDTHKFSPEEEVVFKIVVKNNGQVTFSKVTVTDNLPSFLELVSGQTTTEIKDMAPGQTKEIELKTKVVSSDKLPGDKTLICLVNKAEVVADSQTDEDSAEFCVEKVEKKVLGVTTQPKAGVETLLLTFGSFIITTSGLILKKKSTRV